MLTVGRQTVDLALNAAGARNTFITLHVKLSETYNIRPLRATLQGRTLTLRRLHATHPRRLLL